MSEELEPIQEHGFTNILRRAIGWNLMNPLPLQDEPLASVAVSEDKKRLIFTLADGRTVTYQAKGDCCSSSWIEHLTVPPDIAGAIVESWTEQDMGEKQEDWNTIKVYQTAFQTPKGEIIVEYRNSSNGYYGGWLEGPDESWATDKIERLRQEATLESGAP